MGKAGDYYAKFIKPRNLNGMDDLFEFGLLPMLKRLYRKDYSNHSHYGDVLYVHTQSTRIVFHDMISECLLLNEIKPTTK
jgi:hypothetical protein